jgi:release factor glutamine methyltransferase
MEERVTWKQGDLFEALKDREDSPAEDASGYFDMIVSNPPYIRTGVIGTLEPEDRSAEPYMALDGGQDGLIFY